MSGLMMARSQPIPAEPPLHNRVAENYERFDGLDSTPYPGTIEAENAGNPYGATPAPGKEGTRGIDGPGPGRLGPNARGISGVVGSVGAAPLPVADCLHRTDFETAAAVQGSYAYRLGPGGAYQGVAQTAAMTDILDNPPQPGDFASILFGS